MIDGILPRDPFRKVAETFLERALRPESEPILGKGDIGEAVADVPGSRLTDDLRRQIFEIHRVREQPGDLVDRTIATAADIEDTARRHRMFQRENEGARHVIDVNEIAPLIAVLEDRDGLLVQQSRGENREAVAPVQQYRGDLSYLGTYSADRQAALENLFIEPARRAPQRRFVIGGAQYPENFPWAGNIYFVRHLPPEEHPAFFC